MSKPPRKSAIKSVSVRFNKEVAPFQHIRVEVSSSVAKDDDPDAIRSELVVYAEAVFSDLRQAVFTHIPKTDDPL